MQNEKTDSLAKCHRDGCVQGNKATVLCSVHNLAPLFELLQLQGRIKGGIYRPGFGKTREKAFSSFPFNSLGPTYCMVNTKARHG